MLSWLTEQEILCFLSASHLVINSAILPCNSGLFISILDTITCSCSLGFSTLCCRLCGFIICGTFSAPYLYLATAFATFCIEFRLFDSKLLTKTIWAVIIVSSSFNKKLCCFALKFATKSPCIFVINEENSSFTISYILSLIYFLYFCLFINLFISFFIPSSVKHLL